MKERGEGGVEGAKRINLYLSGERYAKLEEIATATGFDSPADLIRAFNRIGIKIWEGAREPDCDGVYVKKNGEFVRLPFIL